MTRNSQRSWPGMSMASALRADYRHTVLAPRLGPIQDLPRTCPGQSSCNAKRITAHAPNAVRCVVRCGEVNPSCSGPGWPTEWVLRALEVLAALCDVRPILKDCRESRARRGVRYGAGYLCLTGRGSKHNEQGASERVSQVSCANNACACVCACVCKHPEKDWLTYHI